MSSGTYSFFIITTRVWVDCNTTTNLVFGGVKVSHLGVRLALCGSLNVLHICSSFRLLLIALKFGMEVGPGPCQCECTDTCRRVSFCCTHAYASLLSTSAASMCHVITSSCPPFFHCVVHSLTSCSIAHNSYVVSCICPSKWGGSC